MLARFVRWSPAMVFGVAAVAAACSSGSPSSSASAGAGGGGATSRGSAGGTATGSGGLGVGGHGGASDGCGAGDRVAYPADSGVIDVTAAGAKGNGTTDDTDAVQAAITSAVSTSALAGKIVYFPRGTYLIKKPLLFQDAQGNWAANAVLQGECRSGTVLQLAQKQAAFSDPTSPSAVIVTASPETTTCMTMPSQCPFDLSKGEGNDAFRNSVRDLTVDTGDDNPGARGIDYLANNVGEIRRVTVRSGSPQGVSGIAMVRKSAGPCLVSDVEVIGFGYGFEMATHDYSAVLEHITVKNQTIAGIHVDRLATTIRDLRSTNSVVALELTDAQSFVALVDAQLDGGDTQTDAIQLSSPSAGLFARNVHSSGYAKAVAAPGIHDSIIELGLPKTWPASGAKSLELPVEETPAFPTDDPSTWHSVTKDGADGGDMADDTEAIRAALNSGASVIYFPTGNYRVSGTLHVGGKVKAIVGLESKLQTVQGSFTSSNVVFSIDKGDPGIDTVTITGFYTYTDPTTPVVWVDQNTSRTLVLTMMQLTGQPAVGYQASAPMPGKLFLENTASLAGTSMAGTWNLHAAQQVWARQLNLERQTTKLVNSAATVWILGIKTEQPGAIIETSGSGKTELLGGLLYPVTDGGAAPAFTGARGSESLVFATTIYSNQEYPVLVQEPELTVTKADAPVRANGHMVPLFGHNN
jgi:hypothetical protein